MAETQKSEGTVATPVWDIPVRFFHWVLVLLASIIGLRCG